jgi:polyphosphate kinase
MLHDELFMKRISGLKRQIAKQSTKLSIDGRTPREELEACRAEVLDQADRLAKVIGNELRPALAEAGLPILDYGDLKHRQKDALREYFREAVMPILTPLAVDSEHPFPFISNLGLNLAVILPKSKGGEQRFVRIKVPGNRPRWIPVPGGGYVPLEQVIAANLDLLYPESSEPRAHLFRVTRGAEGQRARSLDPREDDDLEQPGSIIRQVTDELKARRFAGVVRLQLDAGMPKKFRKWLTKQLVLSSDDVYPTDYFLGLSDLLKFVVDNRSELRYPEHEPVTHPRLRAVVVGGPEAMFDEIRTGDILLHHPYHDFDSSVLRFIESAAVDPDVLAIKLTIYRTSADSPIVRALAEASRRGKQVAVMVEITARFDEAPNIAWGQYLENEGVHVAYGVERLKTHVKLALVVRQEGKRVHRYAHVGTGNYHTGTARLYEDVGILTADPEICNDVAAVFNSLTGTTPYVNHDKLLVAPVTMRRRFTELIRREAEHARKGKPSGITAKMNQLQDPGIIKELYEASRAGVPITLNVRGLCCLRPGVPGLSQTIRVFSVVGRFLEHSRIYRFANAGSPEYYIGSADWMRRNLNNRVETIVPVLDKTLMRQLDEILEVYEADNASAWDCGPDGVYARRSPGKGATRRAAQDELIRLASGQSAEITDDDEPVEASPGRIDVVR